METIEEIVEDPQDWLRKEIPYDWSDKTELIPKLLFTCLVHFVEEENGLSTLDVDWSYDLEHNHVDQEYIDKVNAVYGDIRDAYNYVKTERPQLQIDLGNSYPESTAFDELLTTKKEVNGIKFTAIGSCEDLYKESDHLELLIDEKDQWAMTIITKNVGYLWS